MGKKNPRKNGKNNPRYEKLLERKKIHKYANPRISSVEYAGFECIFKL